jgi:GNAT superfamily N-acetyltransferase
MRGLLRGARSRFEIRRAAPEEANLLTALARSAKAHWGYPAEWLELWRDDLTFTPESIREGDVYCAVEAGEIVGVTHLLATPPEGEIDDLWVAPARMGEGIGRALLEHAATVARARGCSRLRIASDPHAEPFYRRLGARRIGEVPSLPEGRRLPLLEIDLERSSRGG